MSGMRTCSSWLHTAQCSPALHGTPRGPCNDRWRWSGRAALWIGKWATCSAFTIEVVPSVSLTSGMVHFSRNRWNNLNCDRHWVGVPDLGCAWCPSTAFVQLSRLCACMNGHSPILEQCALHA